LFAEQNREPENYTGNDYGGPWDAINGAQGFRLNASNRTTWVLEADGRRIQRDAVSARTHDSTWLVEAKPEPRAAQYTYGINGSGAVHVGERGFGQAKVGEALVLFDAGDAVLISEPRYGGAASGPASDGALRAPMPGKIVATPAKPGDTVTKGQPVVVLEAMKMEHALVAPFDGVVGEIGVSVGDQVAADAVLATVEANAPPQ
jgi:acetyl/propionyl-CoA carboxylase alpha subunit